MPKHSFSFPMSSKCESLSVPLKIRNLSTYCILTKYFSVVLIWGIIQAKLVLDALIPMEAHGRSVALSAPISVGSSWPRTDPWLSLKPPTASKHGHYGPLASFSLLTAPNIHRPHPDWWDTLREPTPIDLAEIFLSCFCLSMRSFVCFSFLVPSISLLWGKEHGWNPKTGPCQRGLLKRPHDCKEGREKRVHAGASNLPGIFTALRMLADVGYPALLLAVYSKVGPASQCHHLGWTERDPMASEATHAFCLSEKTRALSENSQQKVLSMNSMELFWSHTMHYLCYLSLSVFS